MSAVLIASPNHLSVLRHGDLGNALAFSGNDTLAALEVIKNQPPSVVALEDVYAASPRGRALIDRIEADPTLRDCQIRIVTHAGDPAAALAAMDRRRAPRFKASDGMEVRFDGRRAVLVDVSLSGAQVICTHSLRPNQRGKVTLIDTPNETVRVPGSVAWASVELVSGAPHFRAGIELFADETTAMQRFVDTARKQSTAGIRAVIMSG